MPDDAMSRQGRQTLQDLVDWARKFQRGDNLMAEVLREHLPITIDVADKAIDGTATVPMLLMLVLEPRAIELDIERHALGAQVESITSFMAQATPIIIAIDAAISLLLPFAMDRRKPYLMVQQNVDFDGYRQNLLSRLNWKQ